MNSALTDLLEKALGRVNQLETRVSRLEYGEAAAGATVTATRAHSATGQNFTAQSWNDYSTTLTPTAVAGDTVLFTATWRYAIDLARNAAVYFRLRVDSDYSEAPLLGNPMNGGYLAGALSMTATAAGTAPACALQCYVYESGRTITVDDVELVAIRIA